MGESNRLLIKIIEKTFNCSYEKALEKAKEYSKIADNLLDEKA